MSEHLLKQAVIDGLSPGIKELVLWLNEQGFETTDSGDGTNAAAGMECAVEYPMVVMVVDKPGRLVDEAQRLYKALRGRGIQFDHAKRGYTSDDTICWPQIQASYDPADGTAVILLSNVTSKDLK